MFSHNSLSQNMNKVIFLHIEKTAGTTFRALLKRQYISQKTCHFDWYREPLQAKKKVELESSNLIYGHMVFGLHEQLTKAGWGYITMIRDPIERIISHVSYSNAKEPNSGDILKLIDEKSFVLDNYQTRYLASFWPAFGYCDENLLESALQNIGLHFLSIGVVDEMDASLVLMAERLGWRFPPYYASHNINMKKRLRRQELLSKVPELEELNKLDLRLWTSIKTKVEKFRETNAKELECFRQKKKLWSPVIRVAGKIWHLKHKF